LPSRLRLRPAADAASRFAVPSARAPVVLMLVLAAGAATAQQQHGRGVEHPGGFNRGPVHEEGFHPDRGRGPGFDRQFAPGPVQRFGPAFNPQANFRRGEPLPLNNPETLRPNIPRQETAGPAGGGGAALPGAAGADPGPSPAAMPGVTAPARQQVAVRPLPPPVSAAGSRPAVDRGRRFVSLHGGRHALVPVAALGIVVIGGQAFYPDAYVAMEGPACTGPSADGCQLQWRNVDFEDGDDEAAQPQCVQYCPQQGPAPSPTAALPPPPPLPEGGGECQTTIYSEPNFAGNSAPTGGSQPVLTTTGWRDEIASVVVGAGTWDFYAGENFSGEVLRLTPGTYPRLASEWTRHIGSFLCVRGDAPPA